MKYVSIDTETTGLNVANCQIIEFGAVLDDLNNMNNFSDLARFHCYIVHPVYQGEPYALSMHNTIFKRIAERKPPYKYFSPQKVGYSFKKFLIENGYEEEHNKVHITVAGKNFGSFDYHFIKEQTDIFKHVGIRHRMIDPSILYWEPEDQSLPSTSECKKRAGLSSEVAHNAIDDAIDVIKLIRFKMRGRI